MTGERHVGVDAGGYRTPQLADLRRLIRYAELVDMTDEAVVSMVTRQSGDSRILIGLRLTEREAEHDG